MSVVVIVRDFDGFGVVYRCQSRKNRIPNVCGYLKVCPDLVSLGFVLCLSDTDPVYIELCDGRFKSLSIIVVRRTAVHSALFTQIVRGVCDRIECQ